MTRKRTKR